MRVRALLTAAVVALLVVGCGDQERLESELAAANSKLTVLDSTVVATLADADRATQRADNLALTLSSVEAERDSLGESLQAAVARAHQLRKSLTDTRTLFAQERDSLEAINTALQLDVDRWKEQLENAEIAIANLEQRSGRYRMERDSVVTFVDNLRPWYNYYKHESQRNWLKKLFAAGDAERPTDSEPSFETPGPAVELEAQRP